MAWRDFIWMDRVALRWAVYRPGNVCFNPHAAHSFAPLGLLTVHRVPRDVSSIMLLSVSWHLHKSLFPVVMTTGTWGHGMLSTWCEAFPFSRNESSSSKCGTLTFNQTRNLWTFEYIVPNHKGKDRSPVTWRRCGLRHKLLQTSAVRLNYWKPHVLEEVVKWSLYSCLHVSWRMTYLSHCISRNLL